MAQLLVSFLISGIRDQSGNPLANGKAFFRNVGSTTFREIFLDNEGTIPSPNPVTLDSSGSATIYGIGPYEVEIQDENGVTVKSNIIALDPGDFASTLGIFWVNSDEFGTDKNSTTIQAAIDSLSGNDGTVLLSPGEWIIDIDINVPLNVEIWTPFGAFLDVQPGISFTVNFFQGAEYQHFRGLGTVTVLDGTNEIKSIWFDGITPNDSTFQNDVNVDGTLTTDTLAATTVNATTINADTGNITTGNITTGNITTANITDGNITNANITGGTISGVTSLSADDITAINNLTSENETFVEGDIDLRGDNDIAAKVTYAKISKGIEDDTAGSEEGSLTSTVKDAGVDKDILVVEANRVTTNVSQFVEVEDDTANTNMTTYDKITTAASIGDTSRLRFRQSNDAASVETFSRISSIATDVTDGNETGNLLIEVQDAGSTEDSATFKPGEIETENLSSPSAQMTFLSPNVMNEKSDFLNGVEITYLDDSFINPLLINIRNDFPQTDAIVINNPDINTFWDNGIIWKSEDIEILRVSANSIGTGPALVPSGQIFLTGGTAGHEMLGFTQGNIPYPSPHVRIANPVASSELHYSRERARVTYRMNELVTANLVPDLNLRTSQTAFIEAGLQGPWPTRAFANPGFGDLWIAIEFSSNDIDVVNFSTFTLNISDELSTVFEHNFAPVTLNAYGNLIVKAQDGNSVPWDPSAIGRQLGHFIQGGTDPTDNGLVINWTTGPAVPGTTNLGNLGVFMHFIWMI